MQNIMKDFDENRCRLCVKVFCCQNCRAQHEEEYHNVNPECEICIYGRTTIKEASVSLLDHIKTTHWPLHCVFCNKVFSSLDELIPHSKCSVKIENMKLQGTSPKTPVTPVLQNMDPSPLITPFYKNVPGSTFPIGITSSTPLHEDVKNGNKKITPINHSEIKYMQKSSLKLTGSDLGDSKKSEKRVTFSETPSIDEPLKKPKCLPINHEISNQSEVGHNSSDSTEDSYVSVEEQTCDVAPCTSHSNEDKENNDDNKITTCNKYESSATIWESALTNLNFDCPQKVETHYNLALQINIFGDTPKSNDSSNLNSSDLRDVATNKSIWTSMTNMVKSVMNNISITAQNTFPSVSIKRCRSDNDFPTDELPVLKRMKLTELKCRRPIRECPMYQNFREMRKYVDKATQTDEIWI